jgi:hypothetical protein
LKTGVSHHLIQPFVLYDVKAKSSFFPFGVLQVIHPIIAKSTLLPGSAFFLASWASG